MINTRHKLAVVFLLITIGSTIGFVVNHFMAYAGQPYEIDVIHTHLALALDTHNISAKVGYIDSTIEKLGSYHGNSEWWYPKEYSNIDATKTLLETVSEDVHQQLGVKEREHYFILPHNELVEYMNTEIIEAGGRLNAYEHGLYWNPQNNIALYILIFGSLVWTFLTIFFLVWGCEYDYSRKWERQYLDKLEKKEQD